MSYTSMYLINIRYRLLVSVHKKNQMYIPKMESIFGSDFMIPEVDRMQCQNKEYCCNVVTTRKSFS